MTFKQQQLKNQEKTIKLLGKKVTDVHFHVKPWAPVSVGPPEGYRDPNVSELFARSKTKPLVLVGFFQLLDSEKK